MHINFPASSSFTRDKLMQTSLKMTTITLDNHTIRTSEVRVNGQNIKLERDSIFG